MTSRSRDDGDMISAFGVEHGEVSKGLPRAVAEGGGGHYGRMMRIRNNAGKIGYKGSEKRYGQMAAKSIKNDIFMDSHNFSRRPAGATKRVLP